MKNVPYIGPRPYQRGERRNFYGRNREARDLLALIKAERAVLFYAQSGAGKTSLLNAQIIPALEDEGFTVLPVARVGSDLPPGVDPHAAPNIFVLSALMTLAGENVPVESLLRHTLSSFLREVQARSSHADGFLPILILDQFEEILTTHRDRWQEAQGFFEQLRDALRELPTLGVVLAMREDHLAGLDAYAARMPKRLRARFRMELLGRAGALEVIKKPAQQAGCPFDADVAERLADDLGRVRVQHYGQASEEQAVIGPHVEPVQLQVVCQRLWENLPEGHSLIRWDDVKQYGDVDRALIDFYESAATEAGQVSGERVVRRWFSEQLITPMQTRGLVLRGESETAGLPNAAVDLLERRHLIRADVRAGARWYELVHDRLVEPIVRSNVAWEKARETPLRLAARRWRDAHELSLLYRDKALKDALAWAAAHPAEVEPYEAEFLDASQHAEKIRQRTRVLTTVGVIVATLIAVVMTYLAVTAERARQVAEQQRRIALARQLAAQSQVYTGDQLDRALLLSLEANRLTDLVEVKSSLLSSLVQSPRLDTFLLAHNGVVALSPDGKTMASGDTRGVIRWWDLATRQLIGEPLTGHTDRVWWLAFSPDGKLLASASTDGTIILWDVAARKMIGAPLDAHESDVRSIAFSPDGKWLVSGSFDKTVIVWDVAMRQPIGEPLTGHKYTVISVAFSPDGKLIASGSCAQVDKAGACTVGEIRLWDAITRKPVGAPLEGQTNWVLSVAFSPDGKLLAAGNQDYSVALWEVDKRLRLVPDLQRHKALVASVAFSPDGKVLASASQDKTIILWDVATRQPLDDPLTGHTSALRNVAFSPDGRRMASGANTEIILWDVAARHPLGEAIKGHANRVYAVAFSPDGKTLASGSCAVLGGNDKCSPGEIRLWNVATRQLSGQPLTYHADWVESLAFSPDGKWLASGSDDKTIVLMDTASRQPSGAPLAGHTDWIYGIAFSPDGKLLASGSRDDTLILWDVAARKMIGSPLADHMADIKAVAFSPDGKRLASGSCARVYEESLCSEGEVRVWDVAARKQVGSALLGHRGWVRSVAFRPDGNLLASGAEDNNVILWDAATLKPVGAPLVGHKAAVWSMAFSPDGKLLASGSRDGTVILWDVATRQRLGSPLRGHTNTVRSLAFSPDGKLIASGGSDNDIVLWNVNLDVWKARACRMANRNLTQAEWKQFVGADLPYQLSCPDLPPGQ